MADIQHFISHGRAAFAQHDFFAAHEAFEDAWRLADGDQKAFLRALTQVAVALHHHSTGNRTGALSVLARASAGLAPFPDRYLDIPLATLRPALAAWLEHLSTSAPQPPFPRL